MNNRRSLVLAAILFLGAIAAGFWGLMLARQQPVPPAPVAQVVEQGVSHIEDQTKQSVVVLTRDVAPHVALTADDLTLEKLRGARREPHLYRPGGGTHPMARAERGYLAQ